MLRRFSVGFRQNQDHIDRNLLVWEFLQNTIRSLEGAPRASEQEARNLAGAFLFTGGEQDKAVGDLSGGERGRLVLASLIASAKNLLVLDEPTNHLDIPSAERLEESLDKFGGSRSGVGGKGGHGGVLLLISHDRALLDDVCDTIVVLDGEGNARVFDGRYSEWEQKERTERTEAAERAKKQSTRPAPRQERPAPKQERPAQQAAAGKSKRRFSNMPIEKIEARIADIGRELMQIDFDFADPRTASDAARTKKLLAKREELQKEQAELEAEWLEKSS